MDSKSPIKTHDWHIPRPTLSSNNGSISDARSRGGSASSQGSSSNNSTHSVSSGSLLLSAAHLARMNGRNIPQDEFAAHPNRTANLGRKSTMSNAVVSIPEETRDATDTFWMDVKRGSVVGQDAASVASSTHFTVVNGFTKHRPSKEPKSCCCNHSHQITVLVISMTILFSACILAAICFVEMRMRRETGMYKYS
ncbi:uncharacterized protein [Maniola hyperantus]|uniref:uncharacterized protein isoform X1 n=1 Tax=Aphantopus hyperantus TaxID=2795564 RepID=UPI001568848C|nr:uncharacterized protein LOC117982263 isoform X1 [Maniola hyperantus]